MRRQRGGEETESRGTNGFKLKRNSSPTLVSASLFHGFETASASSSALDACDFFVSSAQHGMIMTCFQPRITLII